MYYLKARSQVGTGVFVDDYFEAGSDGGLMRVVSHAGGQWFTSSAGDDTVDLAELDAAGRITAAEFERVWRYATVSQPAERSTSIQV
jgi:hypothetical protein